MQFDSLFFFLVFSNFMPLILLKVPMLAGFPFSDSAFGSSLRKSCYFKFITIFSIFSMLSSFSFYILVYDWSQIFVHGWAWDSLTSLYTSNWSGTIYWRLLFAFTSFCQNYLTVYSWYYLLFYSIDLFSLLSTTLFRLL